MSELADDDRIGATVIESAPDVDVLLLHDGQPGCIEASEWGACRSHPGRRGCRGRLEGAFPSTSRLLTAPTTATTAVAAPTATTANSALPRLLRCRQNPMSLFTSRILG